MPHPLSRRYCPPMNPLPPPLKSRMAKRHFAAVRSRRQDDTAIPRRSRLTARGDRTPHRLGYRRAERVAPSEPPAGRDADPSALFAVGDRLQPGARHRQLDPALVRADADPRQYRYRRRTRAGARARGVLPYHHAIDDHLGQRQLRELPTAVIAMHSFTPVFRGIAPLAGGAAV